MKYSVGLLGLLLASSVWAAAEEMTMYATLSAPIASFWSVETQSQSCGDSDAMFSGEVNLGTTSSTNGTIQLKGRQEGNQLLTVENLYMGKGATLQLGPNKRWIVSTLLIGSKGKVTLGGNLIVNQLYLYAPQGDNTTITVSNTLRVGSNITVPQATFTKIETANCSSPTNKKFCFVNNNNGAPTTATIANWDTGYLKY